MGELLTQLGLDHTVFVQFAIFAVVFPILANFFFKPFLKLIEARHKRTVEDREAAEKMMGEANARFEEYKRRLSEERATAKKDYEEILAAVKREEGELLSQARAEAKKITQEAMDDVVKQREHVQQQLAREADVIAKTISETLLARRG